MQWRKESLLALKGSRSRFIALGKGKLWLVTELRLTGRERQLLLQLRPPRVLRECRLGTGSRPLWQADGTADSNPRRTFTQQQYPCSYWLVQGSKDAHWPAIEVAFVVWGYEIGG
jgi:hypothetical protein